MKLLITKEVFCKMYTYFYMKTSVLFGDDSEFYDRTIWEKYSNIDVSVTHTIVNAITREDLFFTIDDKFCGFSTEFYNEVGKSSLLQQTLCEFRKNMFDMFGDVHADLEIGTLFDGDINGYPDKVNEHLEYFFKYCHKRFIEQNPVLSNYLSEEFAYYNAHIYTRAILARLGYDYIDNHNEFSVISKPLFTGKGEFPHQKVAIVTGLTNVIIAVNELNRTAEEKGISDMRYTFMRSVKHIQNRKGGTT